MRNGRGDRKSRAPILYAEFTAKPGGVQGSAHWPGRDGATRAVTASRYRETKNPRKFLFEKYLDEAGFEDTAC